MPRYDYECKSCEKTVELFHSMHEQHRVCPLCGTEGQFQKCVPNFSSVDRTGASTAGRVVKEHIEEAKLDVAKHRKEMTKEIE